MRLSEGSHAAEAPQKMTTRSALATHARNALLALGLGAGAIACGPGEAPTPSQPDAGMVTPDSGTKPDTGTDSGVEHIRPLAPVIHDNEKEVAEPGENADFIVLVSPDAKSLQVTAPGFSEEFPLEGMLPGVTEEESGMVRYRLTLRGPNAMGSQITYTLFARNGEGLTSEDSASATVKTPEVAEAPTVNGEFTIDCSETNNICAAGGSEYPLTIDGIQNGETFSVSMSIPRDISLDPGKFVFGGQEVDSIEGGKIVDGRLGFVFKTGPGDLEDVLIQVEIQGPGGVTTIPKTVTLGAENH